MTDASNSTAERAVRPLPLDIHRCADAQHYLCPDRDRCARWAHRETNDGYYSTWSNFASLRGYAPVTGTCRYIIEIAHDPA